MALWLDGLSRQELDEGVLARLHADHDVTGAVTNPVNLAWSISTGRYDDDLQRLADGDVAADEALRRLLVADARTAADLLLPAFRASGGAEGWITVDALLGTEAEALGAEAARLRQLIDRPNVLVALPPSPAGLAAATAALAEGHSVNVMPVFSPERYGAAVDAVLAGLHTAAEATTGTGDAPVTAVLSVAVNQVDTDVDKQLWGVGSDASARLRGQAGLANARLVRAVHDERAALDRWRALADDGHRPPRLAWVATGVRDPYYAPTHYLDGLVHGDGTATAAPEATLSSLPNGTPSVNGGPVASVDDARATVAAVEAVGVDFGSTVRALDDRGIERYTRAWHDARTSVASALGR